MRRTAVLLLITIISCSGCRQSTLYKVIERPPGDSDSSFQPSWVKLVLLHDGKKLNTRCNNYKGAPHLDGGVPCNLHVGDAITCQAFADRMSDDAGGYDLICGDDRENGKLVTSSKNELIQVEDYDAAYEARRKAKLAKLPPIPTTIVYDEWWSSDYAANAAELQCPPVTRDMCKRDARMAESDFLGKFSAAFQSNPTCANLRLLVYGGLKNTSRHASEALQEMGERDHWSLIVDFSSTLAKQPWTMTYGSTGTDRRTTGEGDPVSMAQSVCEIARNRGGSVIN